MQGFMTEKNELLIKLGEVETALAVVKKNLASAISEKDVLNDTIKTKSEEITGLYTIRSDLTTENTAFSAEITSLTTALNMQESLYLSKLSG